MNALAVALALTLAPLVASLRVTASTLSMKNSALAAVHAQVFVLLVLLPRNNFSLTLSEAAKIKGCGSQHLFLLKRRFQMERIDYVNDSLRLIQKSDGLAFGTDALLLAGYVGGGYKRTLEIGGGTGIISMLLLTRGKTERAASVEVQEEYAELMVRNAEMNGLSERFSAICSDIRDYECADRYDLIVTNPPYMKTTSGRANAESKKNIARHEVFGDINDFAKSAKRLLKFGGTFTSVYRPDRLTDLIFALRDNGLEPKRMTLVYADEKSEPSMVLTEAKAGGRGGLIVTRPLLIYKDEGHAEYSDDMNYILENGSFPSYYKR